VRIDDLELVWQSFVMSAALKPQEPRPQVFAKKLSWEEYLVREAASEVRHELVNGEMYAMAGGSDNHNRIALNTASELRQALKGKPCEPFMADMKLQIELGFDPLGYYPDIMVVCDPKDRQATYRTNPKIIIEVLSKSTLRVDAREKLLAYQALPELEVYVMLHQDAMRAVVHRRGNQWWPEIIEGEDSVLSLDEIEVHLPLRALYERVDWSVKED
jgi:Uma2 family endonuclease